MKPFNELIPRQQFIQKGSIRLLVYGSFAIVLFWSMTELVRLQENANASAQHVEDVMMDYYKETVGRDNTVGMAAHMKAHLSQEDYEIWPREDK